MLSKCTFDPRIEFCDPCLVKKQNIRLFYYVKWIEHDGVAHRLDPAQGQVREAVFEISNVLFHCESNVDDRAEIYIHIERVCFYHSFHINKLPKYFCIRGDIVLSKK